MGIGGVRPLVKNRHVSASYQNQVLGGTPFNMFRQSHVSVEIPKAQFSLAAFLFWLYQRDIPGAPGISAKISRQSLYKSRSWETSFMFIRTISGAVRPQSHPVTHFLPC